MELTRRRTSNFTLGRSMGRVGRWARLVVGALAILYAIWKWRLFTTTHSFAFYRTTALSFVAIFAVYLAIHYAFGERVLARINPWISTIVLTGPPMVILAIPGLGSDAFRLSLVLYIAASLIALFFIRYGGCEATALPTLIFRRRYTVYCGMNVFDVADKIVADCESTIQRQDPAGVHGTR